MSDSGFAQSESCLKIIYSGRVQGVGFRYTTARIARRYPVTGYVKNLADGTVELVVCGSQSAVQSFLDEIATHFQSNIDSEHTFTESVSPPQDLTTFEIRR
ncbi:MAG: acylphosphatase [Planctomycetaceae bacterium]